MLSAYVELIFDNTDNRIPVSLFFCPAICDLSRDNVLNASCSNAERNGKWTGDEQLGKPFETGNINGWMAN